MATNLERVTAHNKRKRDRESATARQMGGEVLSDSLRESIEMLTRAGLPAPSVQELQDEPAADRALGISRIIGAAGKAVELGRRRGELITATEHRERLMAMAQALKRAAAQFPAHLPGDLPPDLRAICAQAMASGSVAALSDIERLSRP
jgi:hypothetical protein